MLEIHIFLVFIYFVFLQTKYRFEHEFPYEHFQIPVFLGSTVISDDETQIDATIVKTNGKKMHSAINGIAWFCVCVCVFETLCV